MIRLGSLVQTRRWLDWLVALLIASASALVVFWQNSRLAVLWDLSYILENSYRMSLGQVPYRDFPFPYAPLTFLIQAALIRVSGRVFFHHVGYCAIVSVLSTLLTWRILSHVLQDVRAARLLSLLLTLPLTVLGVYAIFPHPFYDSDCTSAILISLLLLIHWANKPPSIPRDVITGATIVLPIFIKQNVGLIFTASAISSLAVMLMIDVWCRQNVRKYISLFAGVVVSLGVALLMIHRIAGLGNYIQWTFKFAAQRRTPAIAEMIGVYRDPALKWWLVLSIVGVVLMWLSRKWRWLLGLSLLAITTPFAWPVVYLFLDKDASERAERLVNLWPLVLILSFISLLLSIWAVFKLEGLRTQDKPNHQVPACELILPPIIIATVHGAFMSQQLWGSTYALWPLFVILVAIIISSVVHATSSRRDLELAISSRPSAIIVTALMSLSLLISGVFYIRSHERLDYANLDDGDITHSTLPALKGLNTRGSFLPDFEELVAYADKQIPRDDGILYLPGEDLFYYTTGRQPQFPVLMFDHTINPYSPQEIVDLARARNIQWLIVKDELQLEEEPIEKKDELMALLLKDFESVDSLNNYEIYRRKSPGSDDADDADDSKDDDSENGKK